MEHPPQDSNCNDVLKLLTETDDCQKLFSPHHTCSGTAFGSVQAPVDGSYTLRWARARDGRVGGGKITGVDAAGGATSSGVTSPNNVRPGVRDTRRSGVDDPDD